MKTMLKWLGRIVGLMASIFILSLFAWEGIDRLQHMDPLVYIFLPCFVLALSGYIISWFRQHDGSLLALMGGAAMSGFHLWHHDWVSSLAYGVPFIVAGLLLYISIPRKPA
jgi:hypothetical protein